MADESNDIDTWAEHGEARSSAYELDDRVPLLSEEVESMLDVAYDTSEATEALICEAWGLLDEEAVGSGECAGAVTSCGEPTVIRNYPGGARAAWCQACADFLDGLGQVPASETPILDVRPARRA